METLPKPMDLEQGNEKARQESLPSTPPQAPTPPGAKYRGVLYQNLTAGAAQAPLQAPLPAPGPALAAVIRAMVAPG